MFNILISIGSIVSSGSVWINYNDSYITTSQFGFYLCVVFVSALMSILYIILRLPALEVQACDEIARTNDFTFN